MAITLELPADIEATLAAQARAHGLRLNAYLESLLKQQAATGREVHRMSLEQFDAELDGLAQGSEQLPYLPPEALTRESFYRDHD
jgi:hypothetical protein